MRCRLMANGRHRAMVHLLPAGRESGSNAPGELPQAWRACTRVVLVSGNGFRPPSEGLPRVQDGFMPPGLMNKQDLPGPATRERWTGARRRRVNETREMQCRCFGFVPFSW